MQAAGIDETEVLVDTIHEYRDGINLYLELVTGDHWELMQEMAGGLSPELYRVYDRMLQVNELCDNFLF